MNIEQSKRNFTTKQKVARALGVGLMAGGLAGVGFTLIDDGFMWNENDTHARQIVSTYIPPVPDEALKQAQMQVDDYLKQTEKAGRLGNTSFDIPQAGSIKASYETLDQSRAYNSLLDKIYTIPRANRAARNISLLFSGLSVFICGNILYRSIIPSVKRS